MYVEWMFWWNRKCSSLVTGGTRNCFLSGLPLPQAHQHQGSMEAWQHAAWHTSTKEPWRTNTNTKEAWKHGAPTPGEHGTPTTTPLEKHGTPPPTSSAAGAPTLPPGEYGSMAHQYHHQGSMLHQRQHHHQHQLPLRQAHQHHHQGSVEVWCTNVTTNTREAWKHGALPPTPPRGEYGVPPKKYGALSPYATCTRCPGDECHANA